RSRQVLTESDLILFVLNYNEALTDEDIKLFEAVQGLEYIVIVNKTDLEQKLEIEKVQELAGDSPLITTSLIEEEGINELEARSEEHTSELQSRFDLVCRLLLEKKNKS